jgi:hypothetical protein
MIHFMDKEAGRPGAPRQSFIKILWRKNFKNIFASIHDTLKNYGKYEHVHAGAVSCSASFKAQLIHGRFY